MKKLKEYFQENPVFASTVIITGAVITVAVIKSTAQMIEATAYAVNAHKM